MPNTHTRISASVAPVLPVTGVASTTPPTIPISVPPSLRAPFTKVAPAVEEPMNTTNTVRTAQYQRCWETSARPINASPPPTTAWIALRVWLS